VSALAAGARGITNVELPAESRHDRCLAGQLTDFREQAQRFIPAAQRRRMTRLSQMAAAAAGQALEAAGLLQGSSNGLGLVLGTAFGSSGRSEQFYQELLSKGARLVNPGLFPETVPNAAAGQLAILYGLQGPNCTVCEQAVSSETALQLAGDMLQAGMADRFLVVGVEEASPALLKGLDSLELLRNTEAEPDGLTLSGRTIPGEAAVACVIESQAATARQAFPLARLRDIRLGGQAVRRPKYFRVGSSLKKGLADLQADWGDLGRTAVMSGSFLEPVDREHWSALADCLGPDAQICVPEYATGHLMGAGLLRCLTGVMALQGLPVPLRSLAKEPSSKAADFSTDRAAGASNRLTVSAVSPGGGAAVILLDKE